MQGQVISNDNPIAEPLLHFPDASSGILATRDIIANGVRGIGEQFRRDAAVYNERYKNIAGRLSAINRALEATSRAYSGPITALDIGCGSGNATFAMLQLFEQAHVYATDLSPEMVELVAHEAQRTGVSDRLTLFIADASTVQLSRSAFHLVVGSSMIHHLIDPDQFIDRILASVKPGGVAIFFEPFQAGHMMIRQILNTLVRLASVCQGLDERYVDFFKRYAATISVMSREERDEAFYAKLDDKWMFTRAIFDRAAKRNGCEIVIIASDGTKHAFRGKILNLIYKALGEKAVLPDWAAEVIDEADLGISADLRNELLTEGSVVYTR
jgi:2-polyprenyl-3-methyl-5-hydroxy-6-metoxy-1,4-benzoquinol methylase